MNLKIYIDKKKLENKKIKIIKQIENGHGYSILKSSKNIIDKDFFYEMSKNYDNYGFMNQNLGEELDNLFSDDNYIIGIHRTGYTHMDQAMIDEMFKAGLINNGHLMSSGAQTVDCNIERTVTLFNDFSVLIGQLKASHGYKGSEGCMIVRIPKSYLGKKEGEIKPIYYDSEGIKKLLPEFIYGYIPVSKNGELGSIIHNNNYKNEHIYDNANLIYDSMAYKALEKNSIKKAFIDTYNKYGSYQAEQALLNYINNKEVKYFSGKENRENLGKYFNGSIVQALATSPEEALDVNKVITNFINLCLEEDSKTISK